MTKAKNKKLKFYVWWTDLDAGITTSYDECVKNYSGKPNGRNKKFESEEEAQEVLKCKLALIKKISQVCEESQPIEENVDHSPDEKDEISENQNIIVEEIPDQTTEEPAEKTSEDQIPQQAANQVDVINSRLDDLIEFRSLQTKFNDKIEQSVTNLTIEVGEFFTDFKDAECKSKNSLKEIRTVIDNEIDSLKFLFQELSNKLDKTVEKLEKLTKRNNSMQKEILKLKSLVTSGSVKDDAEPNSTPITKDSTSEVNSISTPSSILHISQEQSIYGIETSNRYEILSEWPGTDNETSDERYPVSDHNHRNQHSESYKTNHQNGLSLFQTSHQSF